MKLEVAKNYQRCPFNPTNTFSVTKRHFFYRCFKHNDNLDKKITRLENSILYMPFYKLKSSFVTLRDITFLFSYLKENELQQILENMMVSLVALYRYSPVKCDGFVAQVDFYPIYNLIIICFLKIRSLLLATERQLSFMI